MDSCGVTFTPVTQPWLLDKHSQRDTTLVISNSDGWERHLRFSFHQAGHVKMTWQDGEKVLDSNDNYLTPSRFPLEGLL